MMDAIHAPQAGLTSGHHMRPTNPRRIELRTVSDYEQRRNRLNSIDGATEHFQSCGIDPMGVLDDHQHWLCLPSRQSGVNERLQRSLSALLRWTSLRWDSVHRSGVTAAPRKARHPSLA